MSDWKPGMRHQVAAGTAYNDERGILDWRCVGCGQWFARWPADDEECPGLQTGDTIDSIQAQLNQLHNQHRTSEMGEAAQLMIAQLDLALHGYTTAQPDTPRVWWLKLLAEVQHTSDPEQRGYARGFAQGIAFAKARQSHADEKEAG